jgi:methylglutaconyl-CoA hydratase
MAGYSEQENLKDSRALAGLMRTLNELAKPTVALVQGSAFGGGVGLVACCDIALSVESARFALTEVKLGLIPSVISPYVVAAIGQRAARRYFVTGEPFTAREAVELGLVHKVVGFDDLERSGEEIVSLLLKAGPEAQAAAKDLVFTVAGRPVDDALVEETAQRIARIRVGAEGQEGLSAFFDKRRPAWVPNEEEG